MASQVALVVKYLSANAEDTRDTGPIPGWRDPLEKEMATHSSILDWESPWTEEPGGLQSWGRKESDMTQQPNNNDICLYLSTYVSPNILYLLDCKEIQSIHPIGDQSWVFIGRTDAEAETPILCPPFAMS